MYQMGFVFCPLCGKVEIIFVDCDWLLDKDMLEVPCATCIEAELENVRILKELVEMALRFEFGDDTNG